MGRKNRKIKKQFIIICGCLLLVSTLFSYIFFYFSDRYYTLLNKSYKLDMVLADKEQELDSVKELLDTYKDIDEKIENVKDEYFEIAKKLEDDIISGKNNKKIAYLTFDDGPYYNTYKVMDILDRYKVGATFFTTSANDRYCYDNKSYDCYRLYSEYIKRGHTIANHTYTHAIFKGLYTDTNSFMDAIIKQEEHIKNQTGGYVTNIMRFPGGSDTARHFKLKDSIIERLRNRGYGWVDWTSQDGDGGYLPNRDKAWSNFTGSINENIEVVLFHDYHAITTSILPDAIEYLEGHGYVIIPLFYESSMVNK